MSEKFIRAEEVAEVMEISVPYAYKIIRKLNQELSDKGYITVTGRVNREYFNERVYTVKAPEKKEGED
ncbi:MAG: LysR family transcriptional regulator [Oscillospiraceae bacterium]|nr:LysR family transcriptional regulator [Oscillospiraceae bacterium]MBQ8922461.1 LysR family transcriptional regulator [Oscillospiraceae bacterium]